MMQSVSLKVVRDNPRPRDFYRDLCGRLDISIIVEGDKQSYIHIGSGKEFFKLNMNEVKEAYSKREFNQLLDKIKFVKGYDKFASTIKGSIIPGSSIKGNVRSRLELSFKGYKDAVDSCFVNAGKPIVRELSKGIFGWRHYRIWNEVLSEDRGVPCNFNSMGRVCLICDLFGSAGLKSLIDFSDFESISSILEYIDLPFKIRVEAAAAGSEYRGEVYFKNLKDYELGLLLLGMGIKDSHVGRKVILGRFKYRNKLDSFKFGRVKYKLNELRLSRYSKTLSIEDVNFQPNTLIKGDLLDRLCKLLTDLALKKFENRFRIVDEVKILDELK
ncbi:MAG: RAMP superfamily CRISPR-associated protein [Thermoprotei archaeon]